MLRSIPTRRIGALRDIELYQAILGLTPPWTLANGEPDGRKKTTIAVSRSIRLLREKMLSTRKPEEPNFNFNHVRGSQEAFGEPPWTGPGPWARGPGPSGPNTATKSESPAP